MLDDSKISDLKSRYGSELTAVDELVFHRPKRPDYERFINDVAQDKSKLMTCARMLARASLAYPETDAGKPDLVAFERALDDKPGMLLATIVPALHEMAGGTEASAEVKKL